MISATRTTTISLTQRYDRTTIYLHWATAALVIVLWIIGQTIDFFPRGVARDGYRTLHIALGVMLVAVVFILLMWRIGGGRKLPNADAGLLGKAAALMYRLLYAMLVSTLSLGLFNLWQRGDMIVFVGRVPAFDPDNKWLSETVGDLHALSANWIMILAGLHAAAALFHHYILRDDVLRRMSPRG
jgi:cytochrome b561